MAGVVPVGDLPGGLQYGLRIGLVVWTWKLTILSPSLSPLPLSVSVSLPLSGLVWLYGSEN